MVTKGRKITKGQATSQDGPSLFDLIDVDDQDQPEQGERRHYVAQNMALRCGADLLAPSSRLAFSRDSVTCPDCLAALDADRRLRDAASA